MICPPTIVCTITLKKDMLGCLYLSTHFAMFISRPISLNQLFCQGEAVWVYRPEEKLDLHWNSSSPYTHDFLVFTTEAFLLLIFHRFTQQRSGPPNFKDHSTEGEKILYIKYKQMLLKSLQQTFRIETEQRNPHSRHLLLKSHHSSSERKQINKGKKSTATRAFLIFYFQFWRNPPLYAAYPSSFPIFSRLLQ